MADNYQQDIQNYDNLVIPNKVEYEDNYSIKTNFLTLFKYLNIGFSVITIIKKYIDYLKTQINSENIVTEVIQNLFVNKLEFTLDINSADNLDSDTAFSSITLAVIPLAFASNGPANVSETPPPFALS
jgi:hypothetical protein